REPDQIDGRKPRADDARELRLKVRRPRQVDALFQRGLDRGPDDPVGMSVDAGCELAEEVDVFVVVDVPEATPSPADDTKRKRLLIQHGPGVAARDDRRRLRKAVTTSRVAGDIGGDLLGQRARQRIGRIRGTNIDDRTDCHIVHDDELYSRPYYAERSHV